MAAKKHPQMQKPVKPDNKPSKSDVVNDHPLPKNVYVPKNPFGFDESDESILPPRGDVLPKNMIAPKSDLPVNTKPRWKKQRFKLADDHTWKAPDGYVIVVLDRGAVRFNIPEGWHSDWKDNHLQLYDQKPPADTAGISVTVFHLPPKVDWNGLPVKQLLEQSTSEKRDVEQHGVELARSEVFAVARTDIELCWLEIKFTDPKEKRPAFSRHAVGRGFDVATLITFSFWEEDAEKFAPLWAEILRSLELGQYVENPLKGHTLQ